MIPTDIRNSEWPMFGTKYFGCLEQKRSGVRYNIVYFLLFPSIVFHKKNHKTTKNYTSERISNF
jgi:hypothetical protein